MPGLSAIWTVVRRRRLCQASGRRWGGNLGRDASPGASRCKVPAITNSFAEIDTQFMHDESSERPWTEAQWEAFMKRSDARSARFGELLETLRDDPDAQAKLDHEM